MARAGRGEGGNELHYTAEFRKNPPHKSPARSTFSSTTIACRSSGARGRTGCGVEQIVDSAPVVSLLHAPEPLLVDSLGEVLKILDKLVPDVEQEIDVPKILRRR